MLKIDNKIRDEICRVLPAQLVSAQVGATLMQVVGILNGLEEIKEEVTPGVAKEEVK